MLFVEGGEFFGVGGEEGEEVDKEFWCVQLTRNIVSL